MASFFFLVEILVEVEIHMDDLWTPIDKAQFRNWLQSTDNELVVDTNANWKLFSAHQKDKPLKLLYEGRAPDQVPKSDFIFLKPLIDLQTTSYDDIKANLEQFKAEYITAAGCQFAVVAGDFQVWDHLFQLHCKNPAEFGWLIPVLGEWHWTWHILKAIYQVYYTTILWPFAKLLGYHSLNIEADNFHYAEDFLEIVTLTTCKWINHCLLDHPGKSAIAWLEEIIENRIAYELSQPTLVLSSNLKSLRFPIPPKHFELHQN